MNESRFEAVKALVEFSHPVDVLAACIREFDWDYEGEPVALSRAHLINLLIRYLKKDLSAIDVERWANLLEGREDICFEHGSEDQIDEVLHQLANPDLTEPLSEDHANAIITNLSDMDR